MTAHQEFELKLRVDPDNLASIRRSSWWRELRQGRRQNLHSVYFDTPDRRLRDLSISLRTRTDGNAIVQTIKMADNGSANPSRREWETLVPDAVPDPSLAIDPALPRAFRKLTAANLQPLFDVKLKRDTRWLESDEATIELSLDEGAVTSGEQHAAVHEIELELKSGSIEQLFAEAPRLSDVAEARLHTRNKSDLGYGLVRTSPRPWSKSPKLCVNAGMTAGDALQAIVRSSITHLTANDDCARLNLHPEGVHQCRIALRRLRSVFDVYRAVLRRKRIEPIDAEVRWLGKALGSARDLDVLQADLLEPAINALGESEQLAPLISGLEEQKAGAYATVREALSSARYRHFLIDICAFAHRNWRELDKSKDDEGGLGQPLAEFAASALARVHRKLLKRGSDFENLSNGDRHRVRIALKKMRYAVDFFGGVFDDDRQKRFFKSLARLQEDLGRMNDVAVAQAMLARLIGVAPDEGADQVQQPASQGRLAFAAGCVLGWHRRRAAEIDQGLIEDWHAFARAEPFWLSEQSGE
jgi:triphosphatase